MARQGKLFQFLGSLGTYRNVFINRPTVLVNQQPTLGIKSETKEKLKGLSIPEQPKKPLTPYFRYLRDHRPVIHKSHPELKAWELVKQCAQDWHGVSASVKEKYVNEYKAELVLYTKKNLEYQGKLTNEQMEALSLVRKEKREDKKKRAMKKRLRKADKPKRPLGAYMFFVKEKSQGESKKFKDMLLSAKDDWHALTEEQKSKYKHMYEEDRKRYLIELEKWEAKMVQEGHTDIVRPEALKNTKPSRLRQSKKPHAE